MGDNEIAFFDIGRTYSNESSTEDTPIFNEKLKSTSSSHSEYEPESKYGSFDNDSKTTEKSSDNEISYYDFNNKNNSDISSSESNDIVDTPPQKQTKKTGLKFDNLFNNGINKLYTGLGIFNELLSTRPSKYKYNSLDYDVTSSSSTTESTNSSNGYDYDNKELSHINHSSSSTSTNTSTDTTSSTISSSSEEVIVESTEKYENYINNNINNSKLYRIYLKSDTPLEKIISNSHYECHLGIHKGPHCTNLKLGVNEENLHPIHILHFFEDNIYRELLNLDENKITKFRDNIKICVYKKDMNIHDKDDHPMILFKDKKELKNFTDEFNDYALTTRYGSHARVYTIEDGIPIKNFFDNNGNPLVIKIQIKLPKDEKSRKLWFMMNPQIQKGTFSYIYIREKRMKDKGSPSAIFRIKQNMLTDIIIFYGIPNINKNVNTEKSIYQSYLDQNLNK
jgi:hypothetical protein